MIMDFNGFPVRPKMGKPWCNSNTVADFNYCSRKGKYLGFRTKTRQLKGYAGLRALLVGFLKHKEDSHL